LTYTPRKNVIILKILRWIANRMIGITGWSMAPGGETTGDVYGGDVTEAINTMIEISGGKP